MLDLLVCCVIVAAAFAGVAWAPRWSGVVGTLVAAVASAVAWFVLVRHWNQPQGVTEVDATVLAALAISAACAASLASVGVVSGWLTRGIGAAATAVLVFGTTSDDQQLNAVAAGTLLASVLAVLSASRRAMLAPKPQTVALERIVLGALTAAISSVATLSIFASVHDKSDLFTSVSFETQVVVMAAGALLVGLVVLVEVVYAGEIGTSFLVVLAAVCFVVATGQDGVIPAASLAAALLLGPLVGSGNKPLRDEETNAFSEENV